MKKDYKKLAKVVLGTGAAYLTVGEAFYEGVLNMDLNAVIRKTGWFIKEEEKIFWSTNEIVLEANEWYENNPVGDTAIYSKRLKRNTIAKIYKAQEPSSKWAVVLHGYTVDPKAMAHYAKVYLDMGMNVIAPYMYGHGADPSKYASMGYYDKFLVQDWIDYIVAGDEEAKILLHGVSMGAATAMMVTGEAIPKNVVCCVEDCGYTSCWAEFCSQVGPMFHLPALPIVSAANTISKLRENFDFRKASAIKAVEISETPTLFIHGAEDEFVPFDMVYMLYDACNAPKKMLAIQGAAHANAAFIDNELYWNTTKEFISKYI